MSKRKQARKLQLQRKAVLKMRLRVIWLLARRDGYTRSLREYANNAELWGCNLPREYRREMDARPKLRLVA